MDAAGGMRGEGRPSFKRQGRALQRRRRLGVETRSTALPRFDLACFNIVPAILIHSAVPRPSAPSYTQVVAREISAVTKLSCGWAQTQQRPAA